MAHVIQISISDGGVPKLPVNEAAVGLRGVEGDRQADMKHHGSRDQALCLYSLEVIQSLQLEGHPIQPGQAGENITISGLDWPAVVPGTRLRIGGVLAEVTFPAVPCGKNRAWFAGGDYHRMSHELHPGSSRMYAKVLEEGAVAAGDPVDVVS